MATINLPLCTVCFSCHREIPKGTPLWSEPSVGVFHLECSPSKKNYSGTKTIPLEAVCHGCRRPLPAGSSVRVEPGMGVFHPECSSKAPQEPAKATEMQTIFILRVHSTCDGSGRKTEMLFGDRKTATDVGKSGYRNMAMGLASPCEEGHDFKIEEVPLPYNMEEFLTTIPAENVVKNFANHPDARNAIRKAALAKLSDAEKRALGLLP